MISMPQFNLKTPDAIVERRLEFIQKRERGEKVAPMLRECNLSEPTFYKFYNRYKKYGKLGLYDLSKAPKHHGRETKKERQEELFELFHEHPYFSTYELNEVINIPQRTISRLLKKKGMQKLYKPKSEKKRILETLKKERLRKRKIQKKSLKKF